MKAKRKIDGKIIEVSDETVEVTDWIGTHEMYFDHDMNYYQVSDLDFDVEDAKQTESAVISGWVARNHEPCPGYDLHLFTSKPIRRQIMGDWYGHGETKLDTKLFPSLTWESEPIECEIIIKAKKK